MLIWADKPIAQNLTGDQPLPFPLSRWPSQGSLSSTEPGPVPAPPPFALKCLPGSPCLSPRWWQICEVHILSRLYFFRNFVWGVPPGPSLGVQAEFIPDGPPLTVSLSPALNNCIAASDKSLRVPPCQILQSEPYMSPAPLRLASFQRLYMRQLMPKIH